MESGVEELLDMLFEMIDEAKNAPLSSDKCVIERDRALDLIDDIRSQFPMELGEAKKMMANRTELVASAKREADAIRKAAEDRARQLVAEDTITLQARQRANEMMLLVLVSRKHKLRTPSGVLFYFPNISQSCLHRVLVVILLPYQLLRRIK